MTIILLFFIIIQITLLFFMALHDWVHIPPFTDIRALERYHSKFNRFISSFINTTLVLIPLSLTLYYQPKFPIWAVITIVVFYILLTIGTICAWWIPYIFGSSQKHKDGFIEYKNTHHFLPKRDDNVIPNTFHVILHLQVWVCLAIALYILFA